MMNKPAAIYARVSSDRQKENHTIGSQTAALIEYAQKNGYSVPPEWVFQDEGYSGAILVRPGLEALRDLAAEGQIAAVLIYSPDRLSRKYAYQVLLSEELSRCDHPEEYQHYQWKHQRHFQHARAVLCPGQPPPWPDTPPIGERRHIRFR
jgi:hypothetical protein